MTCSRPIKFPLNHGAGVLPIVDYLVDSLSRARYHAGMSVQPAEQGINACVEALLRAGLELREHGEGGSGTEFLLHGNTYANKEPAQAARGPLEPQPASLGVRLARADP